MIDSEVSRLRQLRHKALELRAIARALQASPALRNEPLLEVVACAAWRIARTVSGRLIAHPYLRYQRGPTLADELAVRASAIAARLMAFGRARSLKSFGVSLRQLARELADARALTWALELSDSFARSQAELRAALHAIDGAVGSTDRTEHRAVAGKATASIAGDWPFLAF